MFALRILSIAGLLALAIIQIYFALYEQTEFSRNENVSALHKFQSNPYLLTWLGKQKHHFDADMEMANTLYLDALQMNPVYIPAWLGLAELRFDQGKKENANAILQYSGELQENIKRWRWDKALVAYQFGRNDILATDLSYIIREIPGKVRGDALRMAFALWPDTIELQEQLGNGCLEYLFQYATQKRKVKEGLILWESFQTEQYENQERETLAFINMLIAKGDVESAAEIWKKYFIRSGLLYNGDFKKEPLQTAFGWRIGKNKGSSWYLEEGMKNDPQTSFHIHFKRQKNIFLHNVYQIVPLQGGKVYALKGKIKTKNLTTDQLPYLEAYGYQCKAPHRKTEMVSSDQGWKDIYLLFEVPRECNAMIIRLRRNASTHIDNKLGGDIWLANFVIAETEEIFTILDEE